MNRKPRINTRCVASGYAGAEERIVEVTTHEGVGCLVAFTTTENGLLINVYRADPGVRVIAPSRRMRKRDQ